MKKQWTKCYLLLGTFLMVAIAGLCSLTLEKANITQALNKSEFESTYEIFVDFIIPGPSYSQVEELENDNNGIAVVTPYWETNTSVSINGKSAKGTTLLFPYEEKMEYTPYSSSRVIKGEYSSQGGSALIDKDYAEANGCEIGDIAKITIADHTYSFTIKTVMQSNNYYNGTIALILTKEDADQLQNDGIRYSAAYVYAEDVTKSKSYLETEYKPLGRLKNADEFSTVETYNQHVNDFNEADWSKEITDCRSNYEMLSVKYDNVQTNIYVNIAIMCIIIAIVIVVFNTALLKSENMQKYMKAFLVKKSGTKNDVKEFYKSGIRTNAVTFSVVMLAFYVLLTFKTITLFLSLQIINCILPVLVAIIVSAIMSRICTGYVENHYKIRRKKDSEDIEIEIV